MASNRGIKGDTAIPVAITDVETGLGFTGIPADITSSPADPLYVAPIVAGASVSPTNPLPTSDAGAAWTQSRQFTTSADMTGGADLTAAPTAGQKIVIDDIIFSSDTAMYLSFLEETSGTELVRLYISANSSVQITPRGKLKLPTADKKLRGDASVAGNVALTVLYHSEA